MPNMKEVIGRHNSKIAKKEDTPAPPPGCNCQGGPATCPLNSACLTKELVYKATVTRTDTNHAETYTGLTGGGLKNGTISTCLILEMSVGKMPQP